jgi:hypothetical protein
MLLEEEDRLHPCYFVAPEPSTINLAGSLNSYATDGAIITSAVRLKKTPNMVKRPENIPVLASYISPTVFLFYSCLLRMFECSFDTFFYLFIIILDSSM